MGKRHVPGDVDGICDDSGGGGWEHRETIVAWGALWGVVRL